MGKIGDPGQWCSEAETIRGEGTGGVWLDHDRTEGVWRVDGYYAKAEFEGKIPAKACEQAVRRAVEQFAMVVRDIMCKSTPEELAEFIETLKEQDREAQRRMAPVANVQE